MGYPVQLASPTNCTNQDPNQHPPLSHPPHSHPPHCCPLLRPTPVQVCQVLVTRLIISHTLTVVDTFTYSTCTTGTLMHSFPPLQILVITNFLSVAVFQTQYVHLSILFTTSSRTAAVDAPPPVRHPHLTASQCGAIEVHKQTPI